MRKRFPVAVALLAMAAVAGVAAGGSGEQGTAASPPGQAAREAPWNNPVIRQKPLSLAAQVGQRLFFDHNMSGSRKMSCATCHDPKFAYGPPNDLAAQPGGAALADRGVRAVPSLRYKDKTPPYSDLLDNPDAISVPGPGGGFDWDGRAADHAGQAEGPLLDPVEMANTSAAAVVAKVKAADYAPLFRQAFGDHAFDDTAAAFRDITAALQAFQLEDISFRPYNSKFDLYTSNKKGGELTVAELRGMKVFTDPDTGNCASCHYQGAGFRGSSALFTDFSYEAIGVPRNDAHATRPLANRNDIPANDKDAGRFDMGLCGPQRPDHALTEDGKPSRFCGMFKAPTLRNVALRQTFFHNGVIHSLEQAIRFYNTRDTNPELWYPTVGGKVLKPGDPGYDKDYPTYGLITVQYAKGTGKVQKYNDLPARYWGNIDTQMPLDGRPAGSKPPMSEQDVHDLICFLNTLTDDYRPDAPPTAAQKDCVR
ncbi:cytochrome-c peroxidase [Bordetella genomosp. 11]|uniref:Cytochrome-c peroxidase n=1 Tax=Bordetella genomosp. 11 TaxID=1416808 RepID=A0A261V0U7_9BORD|nr:cytochrome c peroxidase [Bordetella genomosp. 11]OZI67222.1 cytochrome-c peroxidase [Bordetella genomosp. 11]